MKKDYRLLCEDPDHNPYPNPIDAMQKDMETLKTKLMMIELEIKSLRAISLHMANHLGKANVLAENTDEE